MQVLTIPASGRLLTSQLAAYGLAVTVDRPDAPAFVDHDPDALELDARVRTAMELGEVASAIAAVARDCERAVEADLEPGRTGNNRIPVIRARATDPQRASVALSMREEMLEEFEADHEAPIAARLIAGLGAPATWLRDKEKMMPSRGSTRLDGVPYNIGSDIVRGALRRSLPVAKALTKDSFVSLLADDMHGPHSEDDRLRWSPPRTQMPLAVQWLAALGLALLPVGLRARQPARTPAFSSERSQRKIVLPILGQPTSVARLRALLALQELADRDVPQAARERLSALGLNGLATFVVHDASSSSMVQFSFGPAVFTEL